MSNRKFIGAENLLSDLNEFLKKPLNIVVIVFLAGFFLRCLIAYHFFGSYDVESWILDTQLLLDGKNVYAETHRYHYAPVLLWALYPCGILATAFNWPMCFGVKLPFIITDVLIFFLLLIIVHRLNLDKKERVLIPSLFFLNPVSIILTAYHGQFGNMAVFFVLLAWFFYKFHYSRFHYILTAFLLSFSIATKHFTIMLVPVFALSYKKISKQMMFFSISPIIFVLTLMPHYFIAGDKLVKNVFGYNLGAGYWGWSGIICRTALFLGLDLTKFSQFGYLDYFNYFLYVAIFIVSFFLVRRFSLLDNIIIVLLIFYVFTTQIAPQYSIWILPFAVLRRGKYFYAYSIICTIHLLAFEYCHYHWWRHIPFDGRIANLIPETFIIFRHLLWVVCVLWLFAIFRSKSIHLPDTRLQK